LKSEKHYIWVAQAIGNGGLGRAEGGISPLLFLTPVYLIKP